MLISSQSIYKHGRHRQYLILIGRYFKIHLLWNHLAKWTEAWLAGSMEGPLLKLFISSWSVDKHGQHRQFLFLVISKKKSSLKPSSHISHNLVGRFCIKFLKTEWKVSDTGSVSGLSLQFFFYFLPILI